MGDIVTASGPSRVLPNRLQGEKIFYLDDEVWLPHIYKAFFAGDNIPAVTMLHRGEGVDEIFKAIKDANPTVLMLDYSLVGDLKGTGVVRHILTAEQAFLSGRTILFYTGESDQDYFLKDLARLNTALASIGCKQASTLTKPSDFPNVTAAIINARFGLEPHS